jgi:hypothetical protein
MRQRNKLLIFIFIAALTVPAALWFWQISYPPTGRDATVETSRLPASIIPLKPPKPEMDLNPCNDVYHLICQKKGDSHDPTGTVTPDLEGEKQALHLYREIITKYKEHPGTDEEKYEIVAEELVQQIYNPTRRGRILAAYQWVLHSLELFFDRQPNTTFTAYEKQLIKSRLKRTKLEIPPPARIYADEPDLLTKNEVYYERLLNGKMRLRVGGAYVFVGRSWFNLIFTLAHELAHSIDPCEVRSVSLSFPAYDRLSACFLQNGIIATFSTRSECGQNDQLSEAFADWLAAHITAEALSAFSTEFHGAQLVGAVRNSVRDLCAQDDESELDVFFHPPPRVRIERLFGSNSKIRNLLGCSAVKQPYTECTFGGLYGK